mmetsp:Transcript_16847/g.24215  ORF Transcript_16847/g.24215 Transcript_16847/m.24215 type:complete len:83 (+) Transcript_16847:457-705(+)
MTSLKMRKRKSEKSTGGCLMSFSRLMINGFLKQLDDVHGMFRLLPANCMQPICFANKCDLFGLARRWTSSFLVGYVRNSFFR